MSREFDKAVDFVMRWEGGLIDDPKDQGGITNFGISKRAFPNIDVDKLTKEQATEIYRKEYWDRCKCDALPESVAFVVFDESVNQGCNAAVCDLQRACVACGASELEVDGIVGPLTIQKVLEINVKELTVTTVMLRMSRYTNTVMNKIEMRVFLDGWLNRAEACLEEALS